MNTIRLALLGFGNVGQALAQLLLRKEETLRERFGFEWKVVAIGTGSHGSAIDPAGIHLQRALHLAKTEGDLTSLATGSPPQSSLEFIRDSGADVLFENTPVNYESGQPALQHLQTALEAGIHAITANKGPVVHGYEALSELARSVNRVFRFESTVMDGAPIFSLWRETLPAAELLSFRGILNSTTNYILGRMEEGETLEAAVDKAQEIGIAETDPSGDLDGWDAAIKVATLARVLMGQPLLPKDVKRNGIRSLTPVQVRTALQTGLRWKLVCQADRTPSGILASVAPMLVDSQDPLHQVNGTSSAVTFTSDVLGPLTVWETDPGPETTAYGLLADFINAIHTR
jgi:homoserine dehydrogenase